MRAAILLALLLASCGGGSGSVSVPHKVVAVSQSLTVINSPGDDSGFPKGVGFVATFDLGSPQITVDSRGVGIVNDSRLAPAGTSQIKTANYSWIPSAPVKPWANGEASVCTRFTASAPESQMFGSLGNYSGADLWFQDSRGRVLIVTGWTFFNRAIPDAIYQAPWINAIQMSGPIGTSSYFTTTAGLQRTFPWSEPQPFGFCVNRQQAQAMLSATYPDDNVSDLSLKQALLSNETNIGSGQSRLVTYFNGWTVSVE